jgi:hypothetical protein
VVQGLQRTQRREVAVEARGAQFENPFGLGQVTQPMRSQVAEQRSLRQRIGDQRHRGRRQQGLTLLGDVA